MNIPVENLKACHSAQLPSTVWSGGKNQSNECGEHNRLRKSKTLALKLGVVEALLSPGPRRFARLRFIL
jgi:hypothetical protein